MKLFLPLFSVCLAGMMECIYAKDPSTYFGGTGIDVYSSWLETVDYTSMTFLESTNKNGAGVAIHWTIDGAHLKLAVAAQATGWVAFGLGESGSMRGADIIMFSAETNTLVDSYVLDQLVMPLPDDCQSWTLDSSTIRDNFVIFEATRLIDTQDTQDRALIDDSSKLVPAARVLAAWGDTNEPSYHGGNTARGSVRFFGTAETADELESFARNMEQEAEGTFLMQAKDFVIPTDRTTYQRFCFSRDDLLAMNVPLDQDLHTIGIEPFIDPRATPYVHHFVLTASNEPGNFSMGCTDPLFEMAYVWAPGDLPLNLPSNVGGPLGSAGLQSFSLEVHYNNPDGDTNIADSSGVRFFFTSKKREYDLGVFETGDPFVGLYGGMVSADGGLAQHVLHCDGTCSSNYVTQPITVIREHLHMHMSGVSMSNAQIRNGREIRSGQVEFWDFDQQGNIAVVQPPFEINPGDAFRTTCNYNAQNNETWGNGSENEMCSAFLFYYPRQLAKVELGDLGFMCGVGLGPALPGCDVTHEVTPAVSLEAQLGRSFGTPPAMCPKNPLPEVPNPKPDFDETSLALIPPFFWTMIATGAAAVGVWM